MSKKNVEDFYPLSPMQQGMLFHSLYSPDSGVYFEQLSCTLQGNLNVEMFQKAWQQIIDRHPVLRTAFVWEGIKEAVQVVYRQVELPWQQYDWQGLSPDEQRSKLEIFLQTEQQQGFQLNQAPLMRLTLIEIAHDTYYFVWSHHHLLLDGWSTPLLIQEVFAVYAALCQGVQISLERRRPYRDYIVWLQQQNLAEAESFWRQKLKGFTAPTPLIVDGNLGGKKESYEMQEIGFSPTTTAALQALSRQHQLTLNTLIQGAWALLLSRYSGEENIVFGTTVSGRPPNLAGSDSMIGLFINTLPVRVFVQGENSLIPWLQQLQSQQAEARQYEYSPLVEIQGWSEVPRSLPLFESIVVFENYPLDSSLQQPVSNLNIEDIRLFERTNYPLTVIAVPGTELLLRIAYDSRRFDAVTISRMLGHLQILLEGMVRNSHQAICKLPMLTAAEQHQLLVEWNQTQADYPQNLCIHQLFEAQVEKTPDAVAVVFEGQQMTYRKLNQRANQLARYLQSLGVQNDSLVGICTERSHELLIALLAILKAGAAYLPLDPAYPQERLAFMLEDAQASVLLTQQHLLEILPSNTTKLVCLDKDWNAIEQYSQENSFNPLNGSNLAYVIYTSGSTGKPKGVQICHSSVVNFLCSMRQQLGIAEKDIFLAVTSLSFDIAALELFLPIIVGGRVVIVSREVASDGSLLLAELERTAATFMQATPATWRMLLAAGWQESPQLKILCGGEALAEQLANDLLKRSACLWNLYGPTETTIWSSIYQVKENVTVSIGRPIANTQIYLLDRYQQPVPVGVFGELYIGGAGLSKGYLNRAELTAEKFISNPLLNSFEFSVLSDELEINNSKLYKTGDLARYLPDGNIEFLGRIDHQVKIRGFRIELGEIEAILAKQPAVEQAVVIAREDNSGEKSLAAYIVANGEIKTAQLRSWLQEKLPSYMIPSAFVLLEKLPLTPNGKIDRRALPAVDINSTDLANNFVSPRTPAEEIVASIWEQLLKVDRVGIHDNFFELGGHSLIATKAISRLRDAFKIDIPLAWLFESPTVAGLTENIEKITTTKHGIPSIVRVSRDENLPLSFAQQRMWFLNQLAPDSSIYNLTAAARLQGALNLEAFELSLNVIIERHEILRTSFQEIGGQPVQVICSSLTISLPVIDLSNLPVSDRESKIQNLAAEEANKPFDFNQPPLLRVTLLRLDAEEHIVLLTMHHIVSDGWSMGVFLEELAALYEAFCTGKLSPLPELTIQYADFAIWQRQWLQGEVLQNQINYWKQQLTGSCPRLVFPNSSPTHISSYQGAKISFILPKDLTAAVSQLSRQEGVTLFMTLLAAYQALLSCYTKEEDIRIGSPIANRDRVELEKSIGLFINTLVLRTNLSGNPSFRELLKRSRQVCLGAYAHQDLPFEKLVEELQPERNASHQSLYQSWFVLQNSPMPPLEMPGLTMSLLDIESTTVRHDLLLNIWESSERFHCTLEYKNDLFDKATSARLAKSFEIILDRVTTNPNAKLSELAAMISETDRQQRLTQEKELQTAGIEKLKTIKRKAIQN